MNGIGNLVRDLVDKSVGGYGKKTFLKLFFDFAAHVVFPEVKFRFDNRFTVRIDGFKSLGLLLILSLRDF